MGMRDEFSKPTKRLLAQRVGTLCSNPECGRLTFGPNAVPEKRTCIGVAAHITAAQEGGQRYDASLTSRQRKHFDNGIWLCQDCANLVDSDPAHYTCDDLRDWKQQAELRAREALENPRLIEVASKGRAEPILLVMRQTSFVPFTPPRAPAGMVARIRLKIRPVIAPRDLKPHKIAIHGRNELIPRGACFLTCHIQNVGRMVATHVRATIRVAKGPLVLEGIGHPNRLALVGGGKTGSDFADFVAQALLPNEVQTATMFAPKDTKLSLELWSESAGESDEVFLFDLVPGDCEFVPRDSSPFAKR